MAELNNLGKIPDYIDVLEEKQSECVAIIQGYPDSAEYIKQCGRLNAFIEVQVELEKLIKHE